MPADSCPRCWRAYRPKYASLATSSPGAQTPKTPHASWGPFSPGSRSWLSRPSPRGTAPSVGEIDHWSELGIPAPPGSPSGDRFGAFSVFAGQREGLPIQPVAGRAVEEAQEALLGAHE